MGSLSGVIFFRIFSATFYSTIALTFCAWIVQSSRYLTLLNKNNISLAKFFKFSSYLTVDIIAVILPISLAISAAFVFHRFIESHQLTAMKSAGMSATKLLSPLITLVSIVTCYLYVSNAYISPKAWMKFREMEFEIKNNINPPESEGSIFSSSGFSVYAQEYVGDFCFKNIFIIDLRNTSKSYSYFAKSGAMRNSVLYLTDGERIEIDNNAQKNSITNFKSYRYDLKEVLGDAKRSSQPNEKFMYELYYEDTGNKALNTSQKALFHQKVTSPILAFIFSLMAFFMILLAPYKRKKSYSRMGCLIALIVFFQGTYFWVANASAKNLFFVKLNYFLIGSLALIFVMLICVKKER